MYLLHGEPYEKFRKCILHTNTCFSHYFYTGNNIKRSSKPSTRSRQKKRSNLLVVQDGKRWSANLDALNVCELWIFLGDFLTFTFLLVQYDKTRYLLDILTLYKRCSKVNYFFYGMWISSRNS